VFPDGSVNVTLIFTESVFGAVKFTFIVFPEIVPFIEPHAELFHPSKNSIDCTVHRFSLQVIVPDPLAHFVSKVGKLEDVQVGLCVSIF
jgi:hypothetical protein